MTWLSSHWTATIGWLTAAVALLVVAIREWRLRRQFAKEHSSVIFARAERDAATRRACDAEAETRAVRAKTDAFEKLDREARNARTIGGDLVDAISNLNDRPKP